MGVIQIISGCAQVAGLKIVMKTIIFLTLALAMFVSAADAVTVWEIRRGCGADVKAYCPKAGYGEPMKSCLNANYIKFAPQYKAVMKRINAGEKVRLC
jgi:hypothetical protein